MWRFGDLWGNAEAMVDDETIAARAARLGVSEEALALCDASEIVDLHIDTFIPMRLFGYDPRRRHGLGPLRGWHFGHLDLPRMADAGVTGGMWSITTYPFRTAEGRWQAFLRNLDRMQAFVDSTEGRMQLVRTRAEYDAARAAGCHACLLAVQGGNVFDGAARSPQGVPDELVTRVTLLHLTNSTLGTASTPLSWLRRDKGLTAAGRAVVEQLDEARIFVDLAHIHPEGFWDAVDAHDRTRPLIDTHTGVSGVTPHWRNLDDDQLRAIAETGGVVGIIYSAFFLEGAHGHRDGEMMVEHLQHIIDVLGEDFAAIGTDYDGAIIPPPGFRSGDSYPRLVELMLRRGWSPERIGKILGGNFLRAFGELRP